MIKKAIVLAVVALGLFGTAILPSAMAAESCCSGGPCCHSGSPCCN